MSELNWHNFPEGAMGQAEKEFAVVSLAQTLKFQQMNKKK